MPAGNLPEQGIDQFHIDSLRYPKYSYYCRLQTLPAAFQLVLKSAIPELIAIVMPAGSVHAFRAQCSLKKMYASIMCLAFCGCFGFPFNDHGYPEIYQDAIPSLNSGNTL